MEGLSIAAIVFIVLVVVVLFSALKTVRKVITGRLSVLDVIPTP